MSVRFYSDKIIARARDMRAMSEYQGKHLIKEALLNITLDTARTMVSTTAQLVAQQEHDTKKQDRLMRDLRTHWRAVQRNVNAIYEDHPINDRHLYAVLAAYHPSLLKRWPSLLPLCMAPEHQHYLTASTVSDAMSRIEMVLGFYAGI